eukprot:Partr_v1_DN27060_c0_g1_i1_m29231 putative Solute carrier family 32 (GABA vesicular transporter), member 1
MSQNPVKDSTPIDIRDSPRSSYSSSRFLISREQSLGTSLSLLNNDLFMRPGLSQQSPRFSVIRASQYARNRNWDADDFDELDEYDEEDELDGDVVDKDDDVYSSCSRLRVCESLVNIERDQECEPLVTAKTCFKPSSGYLHSCLNAINVLVGIGILSLPLSLKLGGWVFGIGMMVFCACLTAYTGMLLQKCVDISPDIVSYSDIGAAAFGRRGQIFVSVIFTVELFTASVALFVLMADSLHALFPICSLSMWKIIAFGIATPTTWMPSLKWISYSSSVGILSIIFLLASMVINGFVTTSQPGSLRHPMTTQLFPDHWTQVPSIFGLSMAGFAGHAIFPSIYKDMKRPRQYRSVLAVSYGITSMIYVSFAAIGYLMFGSGALDEITKNLSKSQNMALPVLNSIAVFIIILNPITKYILTILPISVDFTHRLPDASRIRICTYNAISRTVLSLLVLACAMVFPNFDRIMNLLGALFSFTVSAICPCLCYLKLYGDQLSFRDKAFNWTLVVISAGFSLWGTVWSILPAS